MNQLQQGPSSAPDVAGARLVARRIGRAKRDYLPLTRPAAEIAAMRAIKGALDPGWVMNPGVMLAV